jgi:predicted small lipoprotein YifL
MKTILNRIGLLFLLFLCASCGTTGHIYYYDYDIPKDSLKQALTEFFEENPQYKKPEKFKEYTGEDFRKGLDVFFYFKENPEELYWAGYMEGDQSYLDAHPDECTFGLIAFASPGGRWQYERNLWFWEEKRVRERFEKEILSKLKYKYVKAYD